MVDGFFFDESTEVFESFHFADENFCTSIVDVFDFQNEDGSEEIFGGECGFSFSSGIGFAECLEITMSDIEEFGIFFEKGVDPSIFFSIVSYVFGHFFLFVLKEGRKHVIVLSSHRCRLEFLKLFTTRMIPMRFYYARRGKLKITETSYCHVG